MLVKSRISWILALQLICTACLVAAGIQLRAAADYNTRTIRNVSANPAPTPRPFRPIFRFANGSKQRLLPGNRLVALYGAPDAPVLGVLGRQNIPASIQRVKALSEQYQPYSTESIQPTFEIIATVASEFPTENNDYSREISQSVLAKWVAAAQQAGVYVVLDVQPGRSDFLTQVRALKPLLLQPNVGLALDPEWRLKPTQVPLVQIGSVSIREVNSVANWLAELTKTNHLPQKLFLLHQFRTDMLPGRDGLNISHPELAYAVQMDGQGTQAQKQDTWHAILRKAPPKTVFGWKNFYLKDTTLLSPKQTMQIQPKPWYISYQ